MGRRDFGNIIWDDQVGIGCRAHYVASWHAAPLLFESPKRPIIINITSPAGLIYLFSSSYSTGKAALDRLTHDMAVELAPKNVTALALRPGPTRTEFIEDQAAQGIQVAMDGAETPIFVGRVAAAVIADPLHHEMTGRVHWSSELGIGYQITDENGETPTSARERFKEAPRANPYSDEPLQVRSSSRSRRRNQRRLNNVSTPTLCELDPEVIITQVRKVGT